MFRGKLRLYVRNGIPVDVLPHHQKALEKIFNTLDNKMLVGIIAKHTEPVDKIYDSIIHHNDLTKELSFWIYDFPDLKGTYGKRCEEGYEKVQKVNTNPFINLINVGVIASHDGVEKSLEKGVELGFNSIILNNPKGRYKFNSTSTNVFRYKKED
jgi:hypothetical protein